MIRLCVLPGDGVGREVVPAALRVLRAVAPDLEVVLAEAGWETFRRRGTALPPESLAAVRRCGAALFGAVASPSGPVPGYRSPIVALRRALNLYASLRPVRTLPRPGRQGPDVDLLLVRENTEGLYGGRERRRGPRAVALRTITAAASRRVARRALELARGRRRRLTVVHKGNVLPQTDGLFLEVVREEAAAVPEVTVEEMLADTAAYWLVRDPGRFDVLLCPNLYGDLLSDAAAAWLGSLGMAPSLNLGEGIAVAEPVHGTAPEVAGRGIANPVGAILSGALLLRHRWGRAGAAERIEAAVARALADGWGTPDLDPPPRRPTDTAGMTAAILERLEAPEREGGVL